MTKETISCPLCNKTIFKTSAIGHGWYSHNLNSNESKLQILKLKYIHECDICREHFDNGKILTKHKNEIHNELSDIQKLRKKQAENRNISCEMCGKKVSRINHLVRHIQKEHKDITKEQYYLKYVLKQDKMPTCKWCGKNVNFRYDTGFNDFCCFSCSTSWYAKNTNRVEKAMKTLENRKKIDPNLQLGPNNLKYWINKGLNKDEAFKKVKERQTTFNLDICISKYGEENGLKRWKARQEKWNKNFKRRNFSIISQELFWGIYNNLNITPIPKMYFAQLNNDIKDESGKNNEYNIETDSSYCKLDFYIPELEYCVEFDGDYWHGEKRGNKTRDANREYEIKIKNPNITIIHIKESEYKSNKNNVINEIINDIKNRINIKNGTPI